MGSQCKVESNGSGETEYHLKGPFRDPQPYSLIFSQKKVEIFILTLEAFYYNRYVCTLC